MAKTKSSAKKTAARRKSTGSKSSSSRRSRSKRAASQNTVRVLLEILLLCCLGFCVLLFAAAFETEGSLSTLHVFVAKQFGSAAYVVPILLLAAILIILFHGTVGQTLLRLAAIALWIPASCGLAQLFTESGGGALGLRLVNLLNPAVGDVGTYIFIVLMILMGLLLVTGQSLIRFLQENNERAREAVSANREWREGEKKIREQERRLRRARKNNEALERQEERLREISEQQKEEEERRRDLSRSLMASTLMKQMTLEPDDTGRTALKDEERTAGSREKEDAYQSASAAAGTAASAEAGSAGTAKNTAEAAGSRRPSARGRMHTQTASRLPSDVHTDGTGQQDSGAGLFAGEIHFGNSFAKEVEGRKDDRTADELASLDRRAGGDVQQIDVSASEAIRDDENGGIVETILTTDRDSGQTDVYKAAIDAAASEAEKSARGQQEDSAMRRNGAADAGKDSAQAGPGNTGADTRASGPGRDSLGQRSAALTEMISRAMRQRAEEKKSGLDEAGERKNGAVSEKESDSFPTAETAEASEPTIGEGSVSSEFSQQLPDDSGEASPQEAAAMLSDVKPAETGKNPEAPDHIRTVRTSTGKIIQAEIDRVPGERSRQEEKPKPQEDGGAVEMLHYEEPKEYVFPPIDLLSRGKMAGQSREEAEEALKETAMKLQQTLRTFGVGATVTDISCGPTVTRYELQPDRGVKVSQIVNLSDDIKLNLAAEDIRIEAPIPGKAAIGIEVPNREKQTVKLRDLLETDEFARQESKIAFAAGKDISGGVVIADIAKMPHLLIAGATGSGKSVCINTIITSILYKAKPSEVKMLLIDPKVVELSVYNGIPHLLMPVVTDPKKAAAALNWAVKEMMRRYQVFAAEGVRNITGYNRKIDEMQKAAGGKPDPSQPQKLPQIVIIIDELADLMMVAQGEVETAICRIAQLARAAGMHLVVATQRPSVKVITGVIKANIPSRIAFSVSSGTDSRIIIDMNGAEKLLGKGDMLYYPAGFPRPLRVQGSFVSDDEVKKVVDFLSAQTNVIGGEVHDIDLDDSSVSPASKGAGNDSGRDEYYEKAGYFIIDKDKASIGALQRMFKIGFNRAARIMDQLAENGVVSHEEGTKARKVLMNRQQFEESLKENTD